MQLASWSIEQSCNSSERVGKLACTSLINLYWGRVNSKPVNIIVKQLVLPSELKVSELPTQGSKSIYTLGRNNPSSKMIGTWSEKLSGECLHIIEEISLSQWQLVRIWSGQLDHHLSHKWNQFYSMGEDDHFLLPLSISVSNFYSGPVRHWWGFCACVTWIPVHVSN